MLGSTIHAVGFSRWKRPQVRAFFQDSKVVFVRKPSQLPKAKSICVVTWGGFDLPGRTGGFLAATEKAVGETVRIFLQPCGSGICDAARVVSALGNVGHHRSLLSGECLEEPEAGSVPEAVFTPKTPGAGGAPRHASGIAMNFPA